MREFKEDQLPKKNLLSLQIDLNKFSPATDEEKQQHETMRESTTFFRDGMRKLFKNPLAVASLIVLAVLLVIIAVVPSVYPYSYSQMIEVNGKRDKTAKNLAPFEYSENELKAIEEGQEIFPHIFGTDELCRDYFIRVVYGARVSLLVGLFASLIVLVIGLLYGSISGYCGGKVDLIMMRIVDIIYSLPDTLMVILLSVVLNQVLGNALKGTILAQVGTNMLSLFVVFGLLYWVSMARLVRGQILSIKTNEYVLAARALGAKPGRIIRKHILPNCISVIFISVALQIPSAIFTESFLSFIGLGVQAPMPSLGSLANAARGGIVDETALAAALERGVIRGAAIDNFESEIPSPGNPLLRLSPEARRRVLFSPHLAGVTRAAFARLIRQAIGNLENSLRGLPPQFSVNGLSSIRPSA